MRLATSQGMSLYLGKLIFGPDVSGAILEEAAHRAASQRAALALFAAIEY